MKRQPFHALPFLACALLLAGVLALAAFPASAQGSTPTDDEVNAIASQLYCPVCENIPLDVCPTEACRQWRELIRKQLAEGWTEDRIKDYFVANYGARVLSEPPRSGMNWIVYVLPPLLIAAGAFVLFRALRAWTRPASVPSDTGTPAESAPSADEYVARLEEELRNRK